MTRPVPYRGKTFNVEDESKIRLSLGESLEDRYMYLPSAAAEDALKVIDGAQVIVSD